MSRPGLKSHLSGWKPQFSLSLNRHEWNSCPSRLFFSRMLFRFGKNDWMSNMRSKLRAKG